MSGGFGSVHRETLQLQGNFIFRESVYEIEFGDQLCHRLSPFAFVGNCGYPFDSMDVTVFGFGVSESRRRGG